MSRCVDLVVGIPYHSNCKASPPTFFSGCKKILPSTLNLQAAKSRLAGALQMRQGISRNPYENLHCDGQ